MHAWAAIVMFVAASLGFVGLIFSGVAALMISMGAEVIDLPLPYLVVGLPAVFVGGLLIVASFKFGFRRSP